jgi:hypothetical protein
MLAWILNTTPLNFDSVGRTSRCRASRGLGDGARSTSASRTSRTPKLLMADPKKTGVCSPRLNALASKAGDAPSISSISSRA